MSSRVALGTLPITISNTRTIGSSRNSVGMGRLSGANDTFLAKSRLTISSSQSTGRPSLRPRKSSSGQSRKSSAQPRVSGISARADPRNIGDKYFISNSIRTLVDYLTQHNFDHPISPKILTRPTAKDFNNIMMFLFRQIDANFICSGKIEDEIIFMFKNLHYPYSISKTGLVAVGSPHTWPALLASLIWIIELLSYDEEVVKATAVNDNEDIAGDIDIDDPSASEKAFFTYLRKAYVCFLSGNDDAYGELEEKFVNSFEVANFEISRQIQEIQQDNDTIVKQITELEAKRAYLPILKDRKKDYDRDLDKFQQLIEQLHKHKDQLEMKVKSRKIELLKIDDVIKQIENDVINLSHVISTQELSPEDVIQMNEEKVRLSDSLTLTSESRLALQKKVWEAENDLREKVTALEHAGTTYSRLGTELQLLPSSAKNANGKKLQLEIDIRAKRKSELLRTDVTGQLLPQLTAMKEELTVQSSSLQQDLLTAQEEAEDLEVKVQDLSQVRSQYELKLKRAEDMYAREKEAWESSALGHNKELDLAESRLVRLRDTAEEESRVVSAARRIAEAKAVIESTRLEHYRNKRLVSAAIMESVSQCAEYREVVQRRLGEVRESYRQRLEALLLGEGLGATFNYHTTPPQHYEGGGTTTTTTSLESATTVGNNVNNIRAEPTTTTNHQANYEINTTSRSNTENQFFSPNATELDLPPPPPSSSSSTQKQYNSRISYALDVSQSTFGEEDPCQSFVAL